MRDITESWCISYEQKALGVVYIISLKLFILMQPGFFCLFVCFVLFLFLAFLFVCFVLFLFLVCLFVF